MIVIQDQSSSTKWKVRLTNLLSQRKEFTLSLGEDHGDTTNITTRHDIGNSCEGRTGNVGNAVDDGQGGTCGTDSTEKEGGKGEGKGAHFERNVWCLSELRENAG